MDERQIQHGTNKQLRYKRLCPCSKYITEVACLRGYVRVANTFLKWLVYGVTAYSNFLHPL